MKIIVIGGGAAGCFFAINAARRLPQATIKLFESSNRLLRKVAVSGGGRCNLTNACQDVHEFVSNYPRGQKELISLLNRFGPADTIRWFEDEGISTKVENDRRVFPVSDRSEDIVNCLLANIQNLNVEVIKNTRLIKITKNEHADFELEFSSGQQESCDRVLLATGGINQTIHDLLTNLGHDIVEPVPSLFSFKIDEIGLKDLAGISLENVGLQCMDIRTRNVTSGPILFTHEGISGPLVLKASSRYAREFNSCGYSFWVRLDLVCEFNYDELRNLLLQFKNQNTRKRVATYSPLEKIPKRVWRFVLGKSQVDENTLWSHFSGKALDGVLQNLKNMRLRVIGKSTNKPEFVLCGGVKRQNIDFLTMQSRITPGLYFAGELIDIDGFTGGFNFQNAWSSAWVAAQAQCNLLL